MEALGVVRPRPSRPAWYVTRRLPAARSRTGRAAGAERGCQAKPRGVTLTVEGFWGPHMREEQTARHDGRVSARIRDAALTLFRSRNRECRFEWMEIEGRPFPHLVAGALSLVLRTPFQRPDLLAASVREPNPAATYGLDVFAGAKVFSATWRGCGDPCCRVLVRGSWERRLDELAQGVLLDPGEVVLRLATVRAALAVAPRGERDLRPCVSPRLVSSSDVATSLHGHRSRDEPRPPVVEG